jgi:hypothetical protein
MDQVVWQNVNLIAGGEPAVFKRGELLPEAADSEEIAQRAMLRAGGALRVVEVVYTEAELAEQARQRGEAAAQAEAQAGLNPMVPPAEQEAPDPGPPVLPAGHGGSPVVIGDEEMRAEHEQAASEAQRRREEAATRPPAPHAAKTAWVRYATERGGMEEGEAQGMSRDALAARFREPPGDAAPDRVSAEGQPPGDQSGQSQLGA